MIKVEILYDETTGEINVSGPIPNKIFMFGLLEMAKTVVQNYDPSKITPVTNLVKPFGRTS